MTPAEMAKIHAACFTMPRPWSAAEISALLTSPLCFATTAQSGFALGRVIAGEAEVLTIAVHPSAQGQGHGRALLHALLQAAVAKSAETAFLEVAANNHAALHLYHSAGFSPSGRRRGYYRAADGQPVDAILMALALAPNS